MISRRVEIALWAIAVALTATAGVRARGMVVPPADAEIAILTAGPRPPKEARPEVLLANSEILVARDPFRLDRRPATIAYTPAIETAPAPPPRPPRPQLIVAGIIGGPPWEALIEGIPGRQGSVLVRQGDTLAGLRVRSVGKDTVRVTGMDTTWTLSVRRVWQ